MRSASPVERVNTLHTWDRTQRQRYRRVQHVQRVIRFARHNCHPQTQPQALYLCIVRSVMLGSMARSTRVNSGAGSTTQRPRSEQLDARTRGQGLGHTILASATRYDRDLDNKATIPYPGSRERYPTRRPLVGTGRTILAPSPNGRRTTPRRTPATGATRGQGGHVHLAHLHDVVQWPLVARVRHPSLNSTRHEPTNVRREQLGQDPQDLFAHSATTVHTASHQRRMDPSRRQAPPQHGQHRSAMCLCQQGSSQRTIALGSIAGPEPMPSMPRPRKSRMVTV